MTKRKQLEVDNFALKRRLRKAERILAEHGYTRCTAHACNCDSYHQTEPNKCFSPERLKPLSAKLKEALDVWNNHGDPGDDIVDAVNIIKELGL